VDVCSFWYRLAWVASDKGYKTFFVVVSTQLSINIVSISAKGVDLSSIPSVGLSVCACLCVRKCILVKQLNGSGCHL